MTVREAFEKAGHPVPDEWYITQKPSETIHVWLAYNSDPFAPDAGWWWLHAVDKWVEMDDESSGSWHNQTRHQNAVTNDPAKIWRNVLPVVVQKVVKP